MTLDPTLSDRPETPTGLNHLVLNVRDLERAHRFWTECLGFRQVGTWPRPGADGAPPRMRFYSGERDGKLSHHDLALLEQPDLPADPAALPQVLNHVAVTYPSREAWQRQIRFLMARGVMPYRQIERGATHSVHLHDPDGNEIELVFELPRTEWEADIQAALSHAVSRTVGS